MKLTAFQRDIIQAIAGGASTEQQIVFELRRRGRRMVAWNNLRKSMGTLRGLGKIQTSMAGYSKLTPAGSQ